MNPRSPRVTASEVIRGLEKLGYELVRQSGSHKVYRNKAGKRVTVPFHAGNILHPKLFKSILTDIGMTAQEFARLLKKA